MLNTLWQSLRSHLTQPPEQPADGSYRLRRSARASRARIAVYPDRIEVIAPLAMSASQLDTFVNSHWQWAQNKRAELADRANRCHSATADITQLLFLGEYFPFTVVEQAGLRSGRVVFNPHFLPEALAIPRERGGFPEALAIQGSLSNSDFVGGFPRERGGFYITVPAGLDRDKRQQLVKTRLEAWYRRQVASETQRLVQQHAERHSLHPRSIAVRDQKTRWGSCGPRGDININWRLILAPPAVLEYVVIHEICHLRHRNHAQPFWALVEDHLPHYRKQRLWLKQRGHTLMSALVV